QPCAEAAEVTKVVDVGQRAHGAEVGREHDGAEEKADCEAAQGQTERPVLGNSVSKRVHSRRPSRRLDYSPGCRALHTLRRRANSPPQNASCPASAAGDLI